MTTAQLLAGLCAMSPEEKLVSRAQSGRGARKGCSPLWPCMPVDSATAYVQNGIASEAHARNGGAKRRGRPYGGKFMRRRRFWTRGAVCRALATGVPHRGRRFPGCLLCNSEFQSDTPRKAGGLMSVAASKAVTR